MGEKYNRRPNENAREALDEQVTDLPREITRRWRLLSVAERNAEEYRERAEAIQRTVRQGLESVDDAVVSDIPAGEYANATVEGVTALIRSCPVPFHPWLEAVLRDYAAALDFDSQEFLHLVCDSEEFLKEVGRLGLVRAVLLEIDRRDSTAKERRRGEDIGHMSNEDIVPAVLCHAFEFEEPVEPVGYGTYWRAVVIKWLPDYLGENPGELVALLTRALNGSKLQRMLLAALPKHPERWTEEGRWVAALRGKPGTAFDWAVYADWLDDRDDPRGEYVRLRHYIACGSAKPAEAGALRDQRDAWLVAHGQGWRGIYDLIEEQPASNRGAFGPPPPLPQE